jgi:hypothetical protein
MGMTNMTPTQVFAFTAQMLLTCSVSLLTHASMVRQLPELCIALNT